MKIKCFVFFNQVSDFADFINENEIKEDHNYFFAGHIDDAGFGRYQFTLIMKKNDPIMTVIKLRFNPVIYYNP